MWGQFFFAVLIDALFLWVPGYCTLRAIRFNRFTSLFCAPVITVFLVGILCAVYGKLGITTTWLNLMAPLTLVVALAAVISVVAFRKRSHKELGIVPSAFNWKLLALYLVVGVVVTGIIYLRNINGPGSFAEEYDNVHHLGVIRTFLDTGSWLCLGVSAYGAGEAAEIAPVIGWGFYPTIWHTFAALASSSVGIPVTMSANVANFVFVGLAWPVTLCGFLTFLFKGNKKLLLAAALVFSAFGSFPWRFIYWGTLFPNVASFAILAAELYFVMMICDDKITRGQRIEYFVMFVVGFIGVALTHTNAIFTAASLLIPFLVWQASKIPQSHLRWSRLPISRVWWGVIAAVILVALWMIAYSLPMMQGVVTHEWASQRTFAQSLMDLIWLAYDGLDAQALLAVAVFVGILYSFKHTQYAWITVAYVIMGFTYVLVEATDGTLEHIFGGFWYTDPRRIAASLVLYAIPLSAIGLAQLFDWGRALLNKIYELRPTSIGYTRVLPAALCTAAVVMIYMPNASIPGMFEVRSAIEGAENAIAATYADDGQTIYSDKEIAFVEEAMEIADGELIINCPNDGSAFAYGVNGANIYYRYTAGVGGDTESPRSVLIRNDLDEIATNEDVQEAVEEIDAKYFLQLDQGHKDKLSQPHFWSYFPERWEGVDDVNEKTPGFELLLSEDDMKFYRITAVEDEELDQAA